MWKISEAACDITSPCTPLATKEYNRRHDNSAGFCNNRALEREKHCYEHNSEFLIVNDIKRTLWGFMFQFNHDMNDKKHRHNLNWEREETIQPQTYSRAT